MKKIILADYMGYGDQDGNPVGHVEKVLLENSKLVPDEIEIGYAVTYNYCKSFSNIICKLPYFVNVKEQSGNVLFNAKRMLKSFINIRKILQIKNVDIIWFCNVDQFMFMYLGIFGFHNKRVIVTTFHQNYTKRYHNFFLQKVSSKIELFLYSNAQFKVSDKQNFMFMPDYLYDKKVYSEYRLINKVDRVVCLGTMSRAKKIKETVEMFREIGYPLEICGYFYDKEYYKEVQAYIADNITIENKYVDYEEYLKKLAGSKYCILPYDKKTYENITSGVILESIFVGTVPITIEDLLDKMQVDGLTISNLQLEQLQNEERRKQIKESNDRLIETKYNIDIYRQQLMEKIWSK